MTWVLEITIQITMEGNREREKSYNQTDSYQTEMQKEKNEDISED